MLTTSDLTSVEVGVEQLVSFSTHEDTPRKVLVVEVQNEWRPKLVCERCGSSEMTRLSWLIVQLLLLL